MTKLEKLSDSWVQGIGFRETDGLISCQYEKEGFIAGFKAAREMAKKHTTLNFNCVCGRGASVNTHTLLETMGDEVVE